MIRINSIKEILLILPMIVLMGCQKKEQKTTQQIPPQIVAVEAAKIEPISSFLILPGYIEPFRIVTLASASEGPVTRVNVREGDHVKKGDCITVIGRREAVDASLKAAAEQLNTEEENYRRIKQLVESGAIPEEKIEEAQVRLEQARAQYARTKELERDYAVEAPWNGVISKVLVQDGYYVSPRNPLVELFDPQTLVIQFAVPEKNAVNVRRGMRVDVLLDAYPEQRFQAEITRIYPELDSVSHTRTVEAVLKSNVALLKGMLVRIYFPVSTQENAVTISESAVMTSFTGEQVVFIVKDGAANLRKVKTGIESQNRVQVLEGVKPGEVVVVRGNETLKNGMKVTIPGKSGKSPAGTKAGGAK
jgi:membrane fusion protein (multidrug efflux system)